MEGQEGFPKKRILGVGLKVEQELQVVGGAGVRQAEVRHVAQPV